MFVGGLRPSRLRYANRCPKAVAALADEIRSRVERTLPLTLF